MQRFLKTPLAAATALLCVGLMQTAYAKPLTIYTALEDDEVTDYMAAAKIAMPDVQFHVLRLSTGDMAARLLAEMKNPRAEVIWGFAVTNMLDPRIHGELIQYEPEAAKKLPAIYRGKDGTWFAATGYMAAFCANTERLKSKNLPVPTSWEDLTKPIYKDEIVMPNPAASGTGWLQIAAILQGLGDEKGWELITDLNKNIAQYTSSGSKPCKMARTGEYAIGISFAFPAMQSIEAGFPVEMVIPSKWVGYELEASGIVKTAKNPEDAKRFLDWTLSPEAAGLYKKYKEIVTIPGAEPSEQLRRAGLPTDVDKILYPIDFEKSAAERAEVLKKWQQVTAR
ncbi:ABC transporter substrate-binding protein [Castellaniella sp.]|uniref:ABC transporter substrate-binding protein n=1 Tax=Castellaniella sp. TaxID=1955812 RepID=UPI002AFE5D78|nr:ABC transporter substrate-binding protein [Castellaniella sp.]